MNEAMRDFAPMRGTCSLCGGGFPTYCGHMPECSRFFPPPNHAPDTPVSPLYLLPRDPLGVVAQAMQEGADKYGVGKWRQKTTSWIKHFKAAKRHMKRWVGGESIDADSKVNALGHAIARLLIILEHEIHNLGVDDRATYVDRSHE